jgi:hypothetical protein
MSTNSTPKTVAQVLTESSSSPKKDIFPIDKDERTHGYGRLDTKHKLGYLMIYTAKKDPHRGVYIPAHQLCWILDDPLLYIMLKVRYGRSTSHWLAVGGQKKGTFFTTVNKEKRTLKFHPSVLEPIEMETRTLLNLEEHFSLVCFNIFPLMDIVHTYAENRTTKKKPLSLGLRILYEELLAILTFYQPLYMWGDLSRYNRFFNDILDTYTPFEPLSIAKDFLHHERTRLKLLSLHDANIPLRIKNLTLDWLSGFHSPVFDPTIRAKVPKLYPLIRYPLPLAGRPRRSGVLPTTPTRTNDADSSEDEDDVPSTPQIEKKRDVDSFEMSDHAPEEPIFDRDDDDDDDVQEVRAVIADTTTKKRPPSPDPSPPSAKKSRIELGKLTWPGHVPHHMTVEYNPPILHILETDVSVVVPPGLITQAQLQASLAKLNASDFGNGDDWSFSDHLCLELMVNSCTTSFRSELANLNDLHRKSINFMAAKPFPASTELQRLRGVVTDLTQAIQKMSQESTIS